MQNSQEGPKTYKLNGLENVEHLGAKLGKGAYATVGLVRYNETNELLAMKVVDLNQHPRADEERASLRHEFTWHKQLVHPNIIR